MKLNKEDLLLYAVTDRKWLHGKSLKSQVEESLKGGVTCVQLREKHMKEEDFYLEALEIKEVCKKYSCPFIINDNVGVAIKCGADGVHVGQDDMVASCVREIIGQDKILGVSVQTVEQAIKAEKMGADYIGVGAVFSTDSKDDAKYVDKETLKAICKNINIPVIAIGGISKDNVLELAGTGIVGIAVISAIYGEKNICQATEHLKKATENMLEVK